MLLQFHSPTLSFEIRSGNQNPCYAGWAYKKPTLFSRYLHGFKDYFFAYFSKVEIQISTHAFLSPNANSNNTSLRKHRIFLYSSPIFWIQIVSLVNPPELFRIGLYQDLLIYPDIFIFFHNDAQAPYLAQKFF